MRNGKPVVVAGTEGILTQFMHAENAAEAFVGVLGQMHTQGKIYNVCPKDMHSWGDYYRVGMSILCDAGKTVPIVSAPTQVLISSCAASIAIEDNFAHTRVLTPDRLCRDVPEFRAGGKGGGVRLEEGLRRMIDAMDAGVLHRQSGWTSALTVVDALAGMCAGLKPVVLPQVLETTQDVKATTDRMEGAATRIGFCGAGKQAAVLAATVSGTPGFEIVGVCDFSLAAAQKFADKYCGVSAPVVTTAIAELCAIAQLDGLIIATPPAVRLEPIVTAAKLGIPMMLEKPPAITMAVANRCLAALEALDGKGTACDCTVAFQLRLVPGVKRLRELAATRAVHAVRTIATVPMYHPDAEAQYGAGGPRACDLSESETGGALASQAIHILDAARFVLGGPKVVRARCLQGGPLQMGFDGSAADIDVSSNIQQLYELDGGIFGTHLNHCGTTDWLWELQLVGPDLDVTLRVGIPLSTVRGMVDGAQVHEVFDERLETEPGEPKVRRWLARLAAAPGGAEGDGEAGLCGYADAVASLELALGLGALA